MIVFFALFVICQQTEAHQKISVYLDWFVNPHHAPLIVGIEKGFFEEEGIDLVLYPSGGSEEGCKQVVALKADVALTKQPSFMMRLHQMPLTRLGVLIHHCLEGIVSHISFTNLQGKRIGVSSSSYDFVSKIISVLKEKINDFDVLTVHHTMIQSFLTHHVDAIFPIYETFHLHDLKKYNKSFEFIPFQKLGLPDYEQSILVIHQDRKKDPIWPKFLRALRKSCLYIKYFPSQAWDLCIKRFPELHTSTNQIIWQSIIPHFAEDPTSLDETLYQQMHTFLFPSTSFNINTYTADIRALPYKLVIYLDWFLNPHHAPFLVGIEKGFFKEKGIDVELIATGSSEEGTKLIAAGQGDLVISGQPRLLIQKRKDIHIRWVATLIDHPLEVVVTLPHNRIDTLRDLKGKRIGHASSSMGFSMIALQEILRNQGLSLEEVKLVQVKFNLVSSLLSGQVDAIINAHKTYELEDIKRFVPNAFSFTHEQAGILPYEQIILVAHNKREDDVILKECVESLKQSINYLKHHPQESWGLFIKGRPELDSEVNRRVWTLVIDQFTSCPEYFNEELYKNFEIFLSQK